ncbi:ferrous iron transport protein B [Silvimonas amylolytica]|uniref:Ferrous iron transport protein B n=1 Tax=Silvimonas amylolytica TaxID=449663 RepID=A0ABQ2PRZ2_9NEIS|nr:ferrous iron transport protein B [Silvimonas amylolytica]GGP28044.1 ferrous iron transport protein B [Silvimonas amylolytica]
MQRIALVGMPNTGKSTLFNRITGGNARVANWPGLTVDLATHRVLLGAKMVQMIDLPGIYDLSGGAEDERIAQSFLANTALTGVIVLLNATQLDRQLGLALQLKALGAPMVVALNMADEARSAGITVDTAALGQKLGCPVLLISAKRGDGIADLKQALIDLTSRNQQVNLDFTCLRAAAAFHDEEAHLHHHHVSRPPTMPASITARIDRWILHPALGLPLFVLTMFVLFQLTFAIGTPLQDALGSGIDWIKSSWLEPALAGAPEIVRGALLDGLYDGVGTVLTFAPLIFLFFSLMAVIEDSGYFARAAFMMDGLMARLGLDGRGFVMLMMGFGCNVPALMGTRVIRDPKARRLTMLTIPFALCSARLQIFLFLCAALFTPAQAPWVLLGLYLASIVIALGTAWLLRKRFTSSEPFALELPPFRLPLFKQIRLRGWGETRAFLRTASTMIVAGVLLVWFLTHYPNEHHSYAAMVADVLEPVLTPIGIHSEMSIALIFGFVAKEVVLGALSVITGVQGNALSAHLASSMDPVSAISFMLFTLIYVPCVATVATMHKESKSAWFTAGSVAWSLGLAWVLCFVFYQGTRLIGGWF